MGFLSDLWNAFTGGITNGLGSIVGSGINYASQKNTNEANAMIASETNEANKAMVESTNAANIQMNAENNANNFRMNEANNAANMALNRENIAFQQGENEIARQREDNAVQRRSKDLAAAGLSKTLAAGSAASANAMQAPSNSFQNNAFQGNAIQISPAKREMYQRMAEKVDLAGMNYQINQNRKLESDIKYQDAVTDFLEKNGALPGTNDYVTLANALKTWYEQARGDDPSVNVSVDGKESKPGLFSEALGASHRVLNGVFPTMFSDKGADVSEIKSEVKKSTGVVINTNPLTVTKDDFMQAWNLFKQNKITYTQWNDLVDRWMAGHKKNNVRMWLSDVTGKK